MRKMDNLRCSEQREQMVLVKDGVRYFLHEYVSEEELAQMVIEHYKDIFGVDSLFFDPQTMKTRTRIEARNDGVVLALNQNRWYILEVELAKHPLHKHIIPQITEFSIAYEETATRKKIVNTLYTAIRQDAFKAASVQTQIEDLHKSLTDQIDAQPTIAIVIDQKTSELDSICKKLPFPTQIIEFKTYAREKIGIGVHIHEFLPVLEEKEKIERRQTKPSKEGPQRLMQVLEVAALAFKGEGLNETLKSVARQHGVHESTVRDKCTRQLDINTERFRELIQDRNRFVTFLKERYPQHENLIDEKLA
jgi:hypothetical protein